jgi:hypothetical protein
MRAAHSCNPTVTGGRIVVAVVVGLWLLGAVGFCAEVNPDTITPTNSEASDEIPKLRPPVPELEPTFWEQHRLGVACGAGALALTGALGAWWLVRPKPPVPAPPVTQAREALEPLRSQPETGVVLSRVSQVVRHYFAAAFNLPPGELTTTEFCRAIAGVEKLGPELPSAVAQFLRQCDERKFAPLPAQPPLGAVSQAAAFIDQAETRRAPDDR